MKKNILIAAGGSGGHMTPALVFHGHLKKDFNLFFSSDLRGLRYIDHKKINLFVLRTPRISGNYFLIPFKIIAVFLLVIKSIFILKIKKIDIILSMGGYAPVPICLAGLILRKKIFIYEPNQVLGNSNRFFLSNCEKIFCHNKKLKKYPDKFKRKLVLISPLVRKVFYDNKNKKNTKNKKFNLMIIGGSQGAKIFDEYLHEVLLMLSKKLNLKVFHQTKENNVNKLKNFYNKNNISNKVFYFQKNFFELSKNCNFVITRGGASTLAELFILKIPFLAVPLPTSKDNHQYENAKYYNQKNCAWILSEKKMNKKYLYSFLKKILLDKKFFISKKKSIIKLNRDISWQKQNKIIINEFNENRN